MKNSTKSSEILDSKIREVLDAHEESHNEILFMYDSGIISEDELLEVSEDSGLLTADVIIKMKIYHDRDK